MDQYTAFSYQTAEKLTRAYSTSFGQSSLLFDKTVRKHIYAIYGLVRVADEIVDTYQGKDAAKLLKDFEAQTFQALKSGYSTNPIIQAFAVTAKEYGIGRDLIRPFFKSMRMDLKDVTYTQHLYEQYIYGSAEVIGLMCLKVFCLDDEYKKLESGAKSLGAAYQKVNFLRDIASDYHDRGRVYFPGVRFESFTDRQKQRIEKDIERDLAHAKQALAQLPKSARSAVAVSYAYYTELLNRIKKRDAAYITSHRVRVPDHKKAQLFAKVRLGWGKL